MADDIKQTHMLPSPDAEKAAGPGQEEPSTEPGNEAAPSAGYVHSPSQNDGIRVQEPEANNGRPAGAFPSEAAARDVSASVSASSPQPSRETAASPPPLNLYLSPNGSRTAWLVRNFGLDIFGTWQLSRAARIGMNALSLLLLVIATYEFITWSVLFNVILQAGLFRFSWILTPMAILLALPFVVVTLIYEQQFLTADLAGGSWKNKLSSGLAIAVRGLIIFLVALVNSQPVELLVFQHKIEARLQEERAREEAVNQLNGRKEAEKELGRDPKAERAILLAQNGGSLKQEQYDAAEKDRKAAAEKEKAVDTDYKKAKNRSEAAIKKHKATERAVTAARNALNKATPDEVATDNEKLQAAIDKEQDAAAEENRMSAKVQDLDAELKSAIQDLKTAEGVTDDLGNKLDPFIKDAALEEKEKRALNEAFMTRLRGFIKKVEHDDTARTVYEVGDAPDKNIYSPAASTHKNIQTPGFVAEARLFDWSDRYRVLWDLCRGRRPRWPELGNADKAVLANEMKFYDVYGDSKDRPPDVAAADAEAQARRSQEATQFFYRFWIVFGLALVVPLFTVAMKFLMRGELKAYYSSREQAARCHPEALAFLEARRRAEQASRGPRDSNPPNTNTRGPGANFYSGEFVDAS